VPDRVAAVVLERQRRHRERRVISEQGDDSLDVAALECVGEARGDLVLTRGSRQRRLVSAARRQVAGDRGQGSSHSGSPLRLGSGSGTSGVYAGRLRAARRWFRHLLVAIACSQVRSDARPSNRSSPRQAAIIVSCSMSSASAAEPRILDVMVVATALTAIRRYLGASLADLEWTVSAYTPSFAVLLMTAAALGDRLGRRRLFAAGLAVFAVSSAGVPWLRTPPR
jgi:hypothetical protein